MDPLIDTLYNILFTAYPIGWFATYDKEMNYDKLESDPSLYDIGINNRHFNVYVFWRWYLYATTAAFIIYWTSTNVFEYCLTSTFEVYDLWSIGAAIYFCIVFVVNFKLLISTNTHNFLSIILFLFSISSYVVVLYVSSKFEGNNYFGTWEILFGSNAFIFTMLFILLACVLCEYGWRSIHMIVEDFIETRRKKLNTITSDTKSFRSNKICDTSEDEVTNKEKGYDIRINVENSINNLNEDIPVEIQNKDIKEGEKLNENEMDQIIVANLRRRCIIYIYI